MALLTSHTLPVLRISVIIAPVAFAMMQLCLQRFGPLRRPTDTLTTTASCLGDGEHIYSNN